MEKSEENPSEQIYLRVLDRITEGCQIIDRSWRYVYINAAAAEHGQLRKETLLGSSMLELYPDIQKTQLFSLLKDCMEHRKYHKTVNEFTYSNGSTRWFSLTIQPDPHGILITSIDITELKRSELKREDLIAKLKVTVEEVKTLKGFIPICSNCKKIRDDKGYWQQVESYIQKHSLAKFSHGICPDCTRKLYPKF